MRLTIRDKIEDAIGWTSVGLYSSGMVVGLAGFPIHIAGRISNNPNLDYYAEALATAGLESFFLGLGMATLLIFYEGTRQQIRMKRGLDPIG